MSLLTAELVERKRRAETREAARRQSARATLQDARERLTSATGLNRAFDYDMARLFAQSKSTASIALALYTIGIAAALVVWFPPAIAAFWACLALAPALLAWIMANRFLRMESDAVNVPSWRRRFTFLEFLQSICFATISALPAFAPGNKGAGIFILITLLLYASAASMLSASIRAAISACLLPIAAGAMYVILGGQDMNATMLACLSAGAIMFYMVLGNRAHHSAVQTIAFRAEKDLLIAELEEAKNRHGEARRRAEEANLAKSRFLATMSHELRTPLNAILGFSEVMKSELFGPHAVPQYKEYAQDIHGSGEHLLNIINEILDLSRIEAGRYELHEEAVDLASAADDCRHMLEIRARNKAITLKTVLDTGMPRLWADERAVRQIIINLLANAIKFTPNGGEVTIKVGWTQTGGQYVSIRDTGPGIPEEEIPTVLSSFGRGELAIKTAEQGTGLGLPIVKGLVDLHAGQFHLRSKLREGTEVIVVFPAERVMEPLAPVQPAQDRQVRQAV
jgi:two-component system cell cycle sensor histidine kinase PleC